MNNLDKLRQDILESKTFCFYPFLELSTNPSGHVKPCCYYTSVLFEESDIENYEKSFNISKNSTLEEAWNSDSIIALRKNITNETPANHCQACYRDGAASMRSRSIQEYKNNIDVLELVEKTINNNFVAEHLPKRLELKPSNLCNLKCMMCNSYDSSQIGKELIELAEQHKGIEVYNGRFIEIKPKNNGVKETNEIFLDLGTPDWSNNPDVWDSFIKIVPELEVLSFAGGEPTLLPFVERALQYCVETGHSKHILVYVSSNYTNINKQFLKIMPEFKKFELIASIDGVGLINDYCRYPSKWSQISTNYSKAKQLMSSKNVKIIVNITVNLLNVMNLDSLLYWLEEHATEYPYYSEWPFNINLIFYPDEQRITSLPLEKRKIAIDRLEIYKSSSKILKDFPELVHKINLVIDELTLEHTPTDETNLQVFVNRVKVLDKHRGISIGNYIPDLKELFE